MKHKPKIPVNDGKRSYVRNYQIKQIYGKEANYSKETQTLTNFILTQEKLQQTIQSEESKYQSQESETNESFENEQNEQLSQEKSDYLNAHKMLIELDKINEEKSIESEDEEEYQSQREDVDLDEVIIDEDLIVTFY